LAALYLSLPGSRQLAESSAIASRAFSTVRTSPTIPTEIETGLHSRRCAPSRTARKGRPCGRPVRFRLRRGVRHQGRYQPSTVVCLSRWLPPSVPPK
jgi:hypothetical protein